MARSEEKPASPQLADELIKGSFTAVGVLIAADWTE